MQVSAKSPIYIRRIVTIQLMSVPISGKHEVVTTEPPDLVADGDEDGYTELFRYFEAWDISPPPNDEDERSLFKILDEVLEAELFQVEGITARDEKDADFDEIEDEERTEGYAKQLIDELLDARGYMITQKWLKYMVCLARQIYMEAIKYPRPKDEREKAEFLKELGVD